MLLHSLDQSRATLSNQLQRSLRQSIWFQTSHESLGKRHWIRGKPFSIDSWSLELLLSLSVPSAWGAGLRKHRCPWRRPRCNYASARLWCRTLNFSLVMKSLDDRRFRSFLQDLIGWRNDSRKLIVFSTDAGFHYAGDGRVSHWV